MQATNIEDIYSLSPMQHGILFEELSTPGSSNYIVQLLFELAGKLDPQALRRAWELAIEHHPMLRTSFHWKETGKALQVVRRHAPLPLTRLNWSDLSEAAQNAQLQKLLEEERRHAFDLTVAPLMRLTLIDLGGGQHRLVWSHHHLLLDGWSVPRLLGEIFSSYGSLVKGEHPVWQPVRPFRDYITWLQQQDAAQAERFWREYLSGFTMPTPLPLCSARHQLPAGKERGHADQKISLTREATEALGKVARTYQLTLNSVVQGAWALLLSRYSGNPDVVFGATVSGRPAELEGIERMLGLFINTLPVRVQVSSNAKMCEWLRTLQESNAEARQFEYSPLSELQRFSEVERGQALFDSVLAFMNHPVSAVLREHVSEDAPLQVVRMQSFERTNFGLSVVVTPSHRLELQVSYDTNSFEHTSVERVSTHLKALLESIAANPEQRVSELSLLTGDERKQLLFGWNDTARSLEKQTCLHELFEQQAAQAPDKVAVIFEDAQLSYAELNWRANQLARYLRALGIGPDEPVAICVERSIEMAVAVLGTLKAGAAYVPMDPLYPQERLALMLEDSKASVVLTQQLIADRLLAFGTQVVRLDSEWHSIEQQKNDDLDNVASSDSAAYCIYTSGSTGRPKGAVVTHGALVNYTLAMREQLALSPADRILQFASFSFSVFLEEVFPAWASGAAVIFTPQARLASCDKFSELLRQQKVTGCELPVPFWHEWVRELVTSSEIVPPSLRFVMIGCEKPSPERLAQWLKFGVPLIQVFGLTETSITSTLYKVPNETKPDTLADLPIGKPIANTQVYALDDHMQPVPVGVVGELYIGGEGLARGYLNLSKVTAEKFIPHPFSAEPGARLYRTGDLAKFLPDGNLCFLGRIDDQIKIRGMRVELGEIESILNKHPEINTTVVTAREDNGHRRLVAYVVRESSAGNGNGHAGANPCPGDLRQYLLEHLPEYLVPGQFVMLEELPLTPNGKVDRKALPAPETVRAEQNGNKTGPRTRVEEVLCEVWQEVLGLDQVGVEENFFELGGDSILSIQVVSRAARRGLRLTPRQLFQHQTIAGLATAAQPGVGVSKAAVKKDTASEAPLTPIQHWFFEQVKEHRNHWNQPLLLEVRGEVNPVALETALKLIRRQHPALGMSFREGPDGWRQCLKAEEKTPALLGVVDLSSIPRQERSRELERVARCAQQSLDLQRGQLMRTVLFRGEQGEAARLLVVIHHIVVDGVSWRVLLEDWQSAYEQLQSGRREQEVELLGEATSFAEWARRLEEFRQSEEMAGEGEYWQRVSTSGIELPVDYEGGTNREGDAAHVTVQLTGEETEALLREVPPTYRTEVNDALLTALGRTLWRWTGERHPVVELEGHGREEFAADLDVSRTVGWFATMFPVELEAGGEVGEDLKGVKERLRRIPRRGLGYGLWRYGAQHSRSASEGQLSFNYLGQLDNAVSSDSMFGLARESAGESVWSGGERSHLLTVNASVAGGQLTVNWSYSRQLYRRETVVQLAEWLSEELRALIAHCRQPGVGGFTPSDFPLVKLSQRQLDELIGAERGIEDIYPLSPMQQGMLFHSLYSPEAGEYVAHFVLTLQEKLDEPALRRAWQQTIDHHPVLRASFAWEHMEQPLHVVRKRVALTLNEQDWRDANEAEQQARLDEFLDADRQRGFDFARAPLMRLTLIRTGESTWQLVWSLAMMLVDGWSLPLLFGEVFSTYQAYANSEEHRPLPAPLFRDYIAWLQRQDLTKAEGFWRDYLSDFNSPTPLPLSRKQNALSDRDANNKQGYGEVSSQLSSESTARVQDLARAHQLTMNTLVQGALAVLLSRHSGEGDVVFGATVSGRPGELEGVEHMIGLFINTIPVRVDASKAEPVSDWLRALQNSHAEARQYEFTPLTDAQRWSGVERGQPLFESILVFENYPVDSELRKHDTTEGLQIGQVRVREQTNYPLALVAFPGKQLTLKLEYGRARYSSEEAEMLVRQLGVILEAMVEDPDRKICDLSLLTANERHQILVEWNDTKREYDLGVCVHELFEQQAAVSPTAIAVVSSSGRLTYAELDARSNQLARYLSSSGVGPESRVALFMERSAEMVVAIFGVLKAGAGYVPIEPQYPQERISYMLDDSAAVIVITQSQLAERLPKTTAIVLTIDAEWERIARENSEKLASKVSSQNLVYVIYTSGSTGKPKGVMIAHRALVNYLIWCREVFDVGRGHGSPVHAPIAFDGTKTSLFFPLVLGQSVVMIDDELGVDGLIESFRSGDDYSLTKITPAHLDLLSQELFVELRGRTRTLIVGGEALVGESLRHWIKHAPETRLIQEYGPTETTVSSCWYQIPSTESLSGAIPIGRPISNTEFFILDRAGEPVPVGAIGEIYIGGDGLARGYLNRAALTAERFIPHHFAKDPGARLYRTGDLARYLPDGNIEFIGRADNQVKLRGVRIELGEIESVLLQHPSVIDAAVIIYQEIGEHARLIAYVAGEQQSLSDSVLREYLKAKLPSQMIPSTFVILDHLPLTPNGKVDRKALPSPNDSHRDVATEYVSPRTAEEQIIASIWEQVLGVNRVGATDNFLELGGHSLLATQVISRLRRALGVVLPLRALFEAPTVRELAARVMQARGSSGAAAAPPLVAYPRNELLPLSFAQQRLWFMDQLESGSPFYNMPMAVRLEGYLDISALRRCLREIMHRHESLRTTFLIAETGQPVQVIRPVAQVPLPVVDLSGLAASARESETQRLVAAEASLPFDLVHGPVLRCALLRLEEQRHVTLFTMHHIVSDAWSMSVLVKEVAALYEAYARGEESPLEELPIQYADYAAWQRNWLQGETLEGQLAYWRQQLMGAPAVLELPTDRPVPPVRSLRGAVESFQISPELTGQLRKLSTTSNVTLFMTLLAVFDVLLARYSRQDDISVGTVIGGRNPEETEGLIGFFLNTLVLRTLTTGDPRFVELLGRVRETCLGAYAHQDMPFEKLVEELQPERHTGQTPFFRVAFGLDNAPKKTLDLPGLKLDILGGDHGAVRFDLTLWIFEDGDRLIGLWTYSTDLFDASTMKRMSGHFEKLLQGIVANPEARLSSFEIITEEERRQREEDEKRHEEASVRRLLGVRRKAVSSTHDMTA